MTTNDHADLVCRWLEEARESLKRRDWATVRDAADGVLRLDPSNTEARWLFDVASRDIRPVTGSADRRITLHEAMVTVLREAPDGARPAEIATVIREHSLYFQRSGGSPKAGQIRLRADQYEDLFVRLSDGRIVLKEGICNGEEKNTPELIGNSGSDSINAQSVNND